ncbi:hypothetical protein RA28_08970 [Ruegeria sp. ANG-S4]|uniref:hypothetical protein n=1 Tax=Ruegeria sp. ANG-S4 TaxID=1577904 RepID=UPI00057CA644|nr:hypothetical protein [Ruegeria sp. ANG-S4]KIC45808.1 hypothetical protein RA28_08970 [Ruegeria sp. ANG-S4]
MTKGSNLPREALDDFGHVFGLGRSTEDYEFRQVLWLWRLTNVPNQTGNTARGTQRDPKRPAG